MTVKHASACWSLPVHRLHQGKRARSGTIVQPNHLETVIAEVDFYGEPHLVKFSRYHDNQQFWTVPDERDERIHHSKTYTVTEPEPDEYELYDLTIDPYEERNLAHPSHADDRSRSLEAHMFELLVQQLAKKHLVPDAGEVPGYRPPGRACQSRCRRVT